MNLKHLKSLNSHPTYRKLGEDRRCLAELLVASLEEREALAVRGLDVALPLIAAAEVMAAKARGDVLVVSENPAAWAQVWRDQDTLPVSETLDYVPVKGAVNVTDLEMLGWHEEEHRAVGYAVVVVDGYDEDMANYVRQLTGRAKRVLWLDPQAEEAVFWPLAAAGRSLVASPALVTVTARGRLSGLAERREHVALSS